MKQAELLNTQLNVESKDTDNSQSSKIVEIKDIENTPFKKVYAENKGWFIGCGGTRISKFVDTESEAEELLENDKWNIIGAFIVCTIEGLEKYKEEEKS